MTAAIHPFLMFQDGAAEKAMTFYVSLFPDGRIDQLVRFGKDGPGAEGTVMRGRITIRGQSVMCFDSPAAHAFGFTPAISLFVECESEDEIDRLYAALADGGSALMPLGEYGFSRKFGWINDRFGVSWQVNLA